MYPIIPDISLEKKYFWAHFLRTKNIEEVINFKKSIFKEPYGDKHSIQFKSPKEYSNFNPTKRGGVFLWIFLNNPSKEYD